ncbi:hypothetical protein [Desulfomonile tiedjei]|uniref:Uncharacterized protein n=1 Tax=Desulfomonile tiedjei (strain ATCC 49306 / DSM 6799 / DCB-1) TaxID=706587 RepID=I4C2D1_DESTA|nr:hypothetical protein [Desulfomonile tiedjei]AFM23722.1 hypothetical protein Desti_1004 [Desulfomonile tiedjei DSM 6799]
MNREELTTKINELKSEHGREWKTIAQKLNELGISTLKGKQWNDQSVRSFYNRAHKSDQVVSEAETLDDDSSIQPTSSQELPQALPEWLDSEAFRALRAVLDWWRERQDETMILPPSRPVFKGPRRNSGFHINAEILKRATEKLKKDKVRTGGSMSLLMELLLWEYIGRPEDLLEDAGEEPTTAYV